MRKAGRAAKAFGGDARADFDSGAPCSGVCGGDFLDAGLGDAGLTCRYLARMSPMPVDSSCSDVAM